MANVQVQGLDSISDDDKKKIEEILKKTNLLNSGDSLTPAPGTAAHAVGPQWDPGKDICKIGCSVAEAAAVAACGALTGPAAAVCIAAAHAAGEVCRNNC